MKIVFLDIDGVLVTRNSMEHNMRLREQGHDLDGLGMIHEIFDTAAVAALNHIIDSTGARIVVSSTWRLLFSFDELMEHFKRHGINPEHCIGYTPNLDKKTTSGIWLANERGHEIQAWLDAQAVASAEHPFMDNNIESFVILDDDADMAHLLPRLISLEFETGLTMQCAEETIKMLMKG